MKTYTVLEMNFTQLAMRYKTASEILKEVIATNQRDKLHDANAACNFAAQQLLEFALNYKEETNV